ncbi:glycosyltransferase family 2 protein [Flavobacterium undicola]|uniref:glycosyltransferase family 2 protein n=1 Tax=Flavobacterium undicola TaxID=1932779 RepID=UPI00137852EE|nr:glycosyltransferase family 2 protein [Flavobacterium undicola]MBA0884747.1 glycosyltransferase family 2 protein [Flavobacterium undicola]
MEISFLIVTKNRPEELQFILKQLQAVFDVKNHEVLVFIDGCMETEQLQSQFPWVKWYVSNKSISASPARNLLYSKAIGEIFIGLDDDAHLISEKPIETIKSYFEANPNLGILAFLELKGLYENPQTELAFIKKEEFLTTEFIGCGFAIRKNVYNKTNGFPTWIDIYGEETCLSIEVMNLDYDIFYTNQVAVNHRVDFEKRKLQGKNYFRFQKQLQNSFRIYVGYYQNPILRILKLLWHNFKKYAISDKTYFKLYCKAIGNMIWNFPMVLRHRKSMTTKTQHKLKTLKGIYY